MNIIRFSRHYIIILLLYFVLTTKYKKFEHCGARVTHLHAWKNSLTYFIQFFHFFFFCFEFTGRDNWRCLLRGFWPAQVQFDTRSANRMDGFEDDRNV